MAEDAHSGESRPDGIAVVAVSAVFIVALITKTRGSEAGNMIAMAAGIIAVAVLSDLPNDVSGMIPGRDIYIYP